MQFLYFIPDEKRGSVPLEELERIGLAHTHGGVTMQCAQNVAGPGGLAGAILAVSDAAAAKGVEARIAFKPAEQTWRPAAAVDGRVPYHAGIWNDAKPTAASLVRRRPLGGVPVQLLDGGDWLVPVVNPAGGESTLPSVLDLDDDGNWFGRVAPEYAPLIQHAEQAFKILSAAFIGAETSCSFSALMQIVVAALAANYRVGGLELSLLGVVGTEQAGDVIEAICDWSTRREAWLQHLSTAAQATAVSAGGEK